jgi:hypothetical protein
MNDFGLDLAVIGNGRSAALLDPTARIVWWCYPRFDGDRRYHRRPYDLDSESAGVGRNWDYRYCWLRDAYFVVKALNRLGATQTMEDFISFILGIASAPWLHRGCSSCWKGSVSKRRSSPSSPMRASGNTAAAAGCTLGMDERAAHWSSIATAMQARLLDQAWNEKRGAFAAAIGIDDLDASVLLLPEIGLLETRDPRFVHTVEAIELLSGNHIMRYARACRQLSHRITQTSRTPVRKVLASLS